ncbi:MFS transporter [Alicyclobacillus sp. SO9]|nr:MFS transporter [Alicyclobacillus sp. SO9]
MSELLHSFRYRNYLWLWLVVALTNTGKWVFTLAVTWQVYNLTHSSFWSGALMFASMFPNIIGAPVVGVLADKIERRRLIFIAVGIALTVLLLLAGFTAAHLMNSGGMIVMALLFGLATSTMGVSINAIVPTLVPKDVLYNAYSLQAVGQRGTEFVGPFLAAPLLAAFGPESVYLFGAATYVVAIVFALFLSVPNTVERKVSEGFFASLGNGFRYIHRNRYIFGIIVLVGLHCSLTMAFLGMLPKYVQQGLGAKSSFYGVLMSMVGLGSIFGTLFLAGVKSHALRMKLFWTSAVLSGLSLSFLGESSSNTVAVVAIILVGASQALFMTLTVAFVQEATAEHVRGRVTSVYLVLAAGLMSLANWGYGWLANVVAPKYIMLTAGLLFTVVVGIYWLATRNKPLGKPVSNEMLEL